MPDIQDVSDADYTGQPASASTPSEQLEDFAGAKFTARMPLLTATSAFRLGRCLSSPQWCYMHHLHTMVLAMQSLENLVSVSNEFTVFKNSHYRCTCGLLITANQQWLM